MKGTVQRLSVRRHRVYQLAPGLLVVFKPRGHREAVHIHPQRQRLRVLRGALRVSIGVGARLRTRTLRPRSRPLSIAAGRSHETLAVCDTWLVAESSEPGGRRLLQP
jgi:hypothetical protein